MEKLKGQFDKGKGRRRSIEYRTREQLRYYVLTANDILIRAMDQART